MPQFDRTPLVAITISLALHAAALFGTSAVMPGSYRQDAPVMPIEVRILASDPPKSIVAAKRVARKRAPAPSPEPIAPAPSASSEVAEAPLSDTPVAASDDDASANVVTDRPAEVVADTDLIPAADADAPAALPEEPTEARAEQYPLKRARLVYDLNYGHGATKIGEVTHTWIQDGQRYAAETIVEAVGFASLFFNGRLVQRSIGQFGENGLAPDDYVLERGSRAKRELVHFDWAERKLALAWKNETRVIDLPHGAQDPASMMHQIYFLKPTPEAVRVDLALGRKLAQYVYELIGEEELVTPLGTLRTLHYRHHDVDGALMEVWLDRDRYDLPARIYLMTKKRAVLDQVLRAAQLVPIDDGAQE